MQHMLLLHLAHHLVGIYHHLSSSIIIYHLTLHFEGRWSTTDDFATSFLHFSLLDLGTDFLVDNIVFV